MSLYNDVRPDTISGIVGQDNVKSQLFGVLKSKKVPHSLIFVGTRGTGKTTTARALAKAVNCENPDENGEPCGECATCKAIANGSFFDVIEMDAASNNGVDDVHKIVENAAYAPMGKYKVFILDEVHMFSNGAWNALLKTLEEPPANVLFILCTTEEHKIPATIVSRCRKLYFEKIDLNLVEGYLREVCDKYGKAYDEDALRLIARASDGSMRDALSILEAFFDTDGIMVDYVSSTLGVSGDEALFDILSAVVKGDAPGAIKAFKNATKRGASLKCLVKGLLEAVTDTMYLVQGADPESILNTSSYREAAVAFASVVTPSRLMELTERLSDVYGNISKTSDAAFLVEAAIIRSIQYTSELEELRKRVEALEVEPRAMVVSEPVKEEDDSFEVNLPVEESGFSDPTEEVPFSLEEEPNPFEEEPVPELTDSDLEPVPVPDNIVPMPVVSEPDAEVKPAVNEDIKSLLPKGTELKGTIKLFGNSDDKEAPAKNAGEVRTDTQADSDLPPIDDLTGWL